MCRQRAVPEGCSQHSFDEPSENPHLNSPTRRRRHCQGCLLTTVTFSDLTCSVPYARPNVGRSFSDRPPTQIKTPGSPYPLTAEAAISTTTRTGTDAKQVCGIILLIVRSSLFGSVRLPLSVSVGSRSFGMCCLGLGSRDSMPARMKIEVLRRSDGSKS